MINKIFAIFFVLLAAMMAYFALAFLVSGPQNQTEWTIAIFSVASTVFLVWGAWQTWQREKHKAQAERKENARVATLKKPFPDDEKVQNSSAKSEDKMVPPTEQKLAENSREDFTPEILAHWHFTPEQWRFIVKKLVEKTKKEERYTAFWFPVFFGIIFWSLFYWGILIGLIFGWFYIWFRAHFVKSKFAPSGQKGQAEIIISNAYLRINGRFIHFADGKYFLKIVQQEKDAAVGDLLHFCIGWQTSKGLPAEMDLYIPIPKDKMHQSKSVVEAFANSR